MTDAHAEIERRREALRLTEREFLELAGINNVRFWRAKKGITKGDAKLKVLREAEAALDVLEAAKDEHK